MLASPSTFPAICGLRHVMDKKKYHTGIQIIVIIMK